MWNITYPSIATPPTKSKYQTPKQESRPPNSNSPPCSCPPPQLTENEHQKLVPWGSRCNGTWVSPRMRPALALIYSRCMALCLEHGKSLINGRRLNTCKQIRPLHTRAIAICSHESQESRHDSWVLEKWPTDLNMTWERGWVNFGKVKSLNDMTGKLRRKENAKICTLPLTCRSVQEASYGDTV